MGQAGQVGTQSAHRATPNFGTIKKAFLVTLRRRHFHVVEDLTQQTEAGEWAQKWNIDAPWLRRTISFTLQLWEADPDMRAKRILSTPSFRWELPGDSTFKYWPWKPETDMSEAAYNDMLVRQFREHLLGEAAKLKRERTANGFVSTADRPSIEKYLAWFGQWQVEGMNAGEIADAWCDETRMKQGSVTTNAVHKAISETATMLEIPRRPGRRGRPRRRSKL